MSRALLVAATPIDSAPAAACDTMDCVHGLRQAGHDCVGAPNGIQDGTKDINCPSTDPGDVQTLSASPKCGGCNFVVRCDNSGPVTPESPMVSV